MGYYASILYICIPTKKTFIFSQDYHVYTFLQVSTLPEGTTPKTTKRNFSVEMRCTSCSTVKLIFPYINACII